MVCVCGFELIVVRLGWWQSAAFVFVMLALSHVPRTVLTGEWSGTGWIGAAETWSPLQDR